jgi:hypothetical protein
MITGGWMQQTHNIYYLNETTNKDGKPYPTSGNNWQPETAEIQSGIANVDFVLDITCSLFSPSKLAENNIIFFRLKYRLRE